MITAGALDAQNRARAEAPVILVVTRRRFGASDDTVRAVTAAARELNVEVMAVDADDTGNTKFLDELGVRFVPEVLVCQRGVILDRGGIHDAEDARDFFAAALRRPRDRTKR